MAFLREEKKATPWRDASNGRTAQLLRLARLFSAVCSTAPHKTAIGQKQPLGCVYIPRGNSERSPKRPA